MRFDVAKFLEDLTGRYARPYVDAINAMLLAEATGDRPALRAARKRFEAVMTETLGTAEVLGATIALQAAAKAMPDAGGANLSNRSMNFADDAAQNILPGVTFEEAIEDMVARTPVTIREAAERNAQAIAKLYAEGRVVAFAKSAEAAVTKRAQSLISEMLVEGVTEVDAGRRIVTSVDAVRQRTGAWSQSYARMVFRTNVNTAATAGRFRQMRDPNLVDRNGARLLPAFRFDAVGDGDTRSNHNAADGIILDVTNTAWGTIAPPLGYNCRCDVVEMNRLALQRIDRIDRHGNVINSRIPSAARPDEGFRHAGRPDLFMTGATS